MKILHKLLSGLTAASLLAGALSMTAFAEEFSWNDIAADIEASNIDAHFTVEEDFGIRYWIPDLFSYTEISEEDSDAGVVSRLTDSDGDWSIELYSYHPEGWNNDTLEEYQSFLKKLGYTDIQNATINGMDALIYGHEERDCAYLSFIDRKGDIGEMVFHPMSDPQFNQVASAVMLSVQPVEVLLWDEIYPLLEDAEIEGTFYELAGHDLAYWVPNGLVEVEKDAETEEARMAAAYADGEGFASFIQIFSAEDMLTREEEPEAEEDPDAEEPKQAAEKDAEAEEADQAAEEDPDAAETEEEDEEAAEADTGFTYEDVTGLLADAGWTDISDIYINGMGGISCRNEKNDLLSFVFYDDQSMILFNYTPASGKDYASIILAMASSIQSTIVHLDWEAYEPVVTEKIEGGYCTFEEAKTELWLPDGLEEAELSEEDKENGVLATFATADNENQFSVKYSELNEDASYEDLLEFLADIGATNITKAVVNGKRAVIYTLEEDDVRSLMVMNDASDLLLELSFFPASDEGFTNLSEIIMASAVMEEE